MFQLFLKLQKTIVEINIHKTLSLFIAAIWIANGLFCKVLHLVPRHEQIVARILSDEYASVFTILIGFSELVMAIWILSKFKSKLNAIAQIAIVGIMNILEFIHVPDLLLWGKLNSFFAFIFILLVFFNEFYFNQKTTQQI
jgi:hypothetical protein